MGITREELALLLVIATVVFLALASLLMPRSATDLKDETIMTPGGVIIECMIADNVMTCDFGR